MTLAQGGSPNSRGVFAASSEFRTLWVAGVLSIVGDQIARVALSVLVYQRTNSASLTAVTYALTLLPATLSGLFLTWIADRFPRRAVMISADVVRVPLVATMAIPGMSFAVIATLLVLVQLVEPVFASAQSATLKQSIPQRLAEGQRILVITRDFVLLGGFAGGGILAAAIGTGPALMTDAGTFAVSALVIRLGVRARPAPVDRASASRPDIWAGARLVWSDRALRTLVLFACLAAFTTIPEGLAAPFAGEVGAGAAAVGWLMAADPAGAILGGWLLGRGWWTTVRRLRLLGVLAVGTVLPLIAYVAQPGVGAAMVLLLLSGMFSILQIIAQSTFLALVPSETSGQAIGFARSTMITAQGVGLVAGGLLAESLGSASRTIAIAGAAGTVAAVATALAWRRVGPLGVAGQLAASREVSQ